MKKVFLVITASVLLNYSCSDDNLSVEPDQNLTQIQQNRAHLGAFAFLSSNNSGQIGKFAIGAAIANPASIDLDQTFISVPYQDADGVVYDGKRNALYQVNRSDSRLSSISNISNYMDGDMAIPSTQGPSTFSNGREATIYNNKVVVADDVTPGKLVSYHVNTANISDFRSYDVGIEVWGIQATKKDLYAIEDVSSNVVYYRNFFKAKSGNLNPTLTVSIDGLIRTHGLNYDEEHDVMVLTDIGSAASAEDGGLIIINDFFQKMMNAGDGGSISMSDQIRIYGASTLLGNPVDVAVNVDQGSIFVAERAKNGGMFLVFEIPSNSGDYAPVYSTEFSGASAVTLDIN